MWNHTLHICSRYSGLAELRKHAGPAHQGLLRQGLPLVQNDKGCRGVAGLHFYAQQDRSWGPCCRERSLRSSISGGVVQAQHEADWPANPVALRCCLQACSRSRTSSQDAVVVELTSCAGGFLLSG